jgi:hypothetical protein
MPDLHDLLERRAERFEPSTDEDEAGLRRVRERARARARTRRFGVVGLAFVLVAGAGVGLWWAFTPVRSLQPVRTPTSPPAGTSPRIIATIDLPRGSDAPTNLLAAGGYLWYNGNDGSLRRIDPGTNRPVGKPLYCSMSPFVAFGSLWAIGDNDNACLSGSNRDFRLWRLEPRTGRILSEAPVDVPAAYGGPRQVVAGEDGNLWIASFPEWGTGDGDRGMPAHSLLTRIDPRTMRATGSVEFGKFDIAIGSGFGSIWVSETGPGPPQGTPALQRIDPKTMKSGARIPVGTDPGPPAFGFGSAWVANRLDNTVSRIDPVANAVIDTIDVPDGGLFTLAVAPDGVWALGDGRDVLSRIDPVTDRLTARIGIPVPVTYSVSPPTYAFGSIWVASWDHRTVWRIAPGSPVSIAPSPSPSPSPAPTPTQAASIADGGPCPKPPPGEPRACVTTAHGDLDGDGLLDTVSVFAWPIDGQRRPLAWHAETTLASGGTSVASIGGRTPPGSYPRVLGLFDASGDGRDEAFIKVNGGATNDVIELFGVLGGQLLPVREAGRGVLTLTVGGSIFEGDGAECTAPPGGPRRLVVASAVSSDATIFHWTETTLIWDSAVLRFGGSRSGTIHRHGDNDPRLQRFWVLRCGPVREG